METDPDFLTNDEIVGILESMKSESNFTIAVGFLYNAIMDWPTLVEPRDLLKELKNETGDKLTYDNLKNHLEYLNPRFDAWKMESIRSLLEMFEFLRKNNFEMSIELDNVIINLTIRYRQF